VTKAELREQYAKARADYTEGGLWTNEYALTLDTMLSNYFGLPLADFVNEDLDPVIRPPAAPSAG